MTSETASLGFYLPIRLGPYGHWGVVRKVLAGKRVRINGKNYPVQGGKQNWYVEPYFLTEMPADAVKVGAVVPLAREAQE